MSETADQPRAQSPVATELSTRGTVQSSKQTRDRERDPIPSIELCDVAVGFVVVVHGIAGSP
jgi:hypothetical protein